MTSIYLAQISGHRVSIRQNAEPLSRPSTPFESRSTGNSRGRALRQVSQFRAQALGPNKLTVLALLPLTGFVTEGKELNFSASQHLQ